MSKQRNQGYLPGAEPGGESPHPIFDGATGTPPVPPEFADCPPQTDSHGPAAHHPMAGALAATFGRDPQPKEIDMNADEIKADQTGTSDDEAADTGRRMDSELKTLAAILRLLGEMPESARARIILYLSSRFAEGRP